MPGIGEPWQSANPRLAGLRVCRVEGFEKHLIFYRPADEEGDFFHIEEFDESHADEEDRYITTASHPDDRRIVMRISWTDRSTQEKRITRIISARLATARERKKYAQETQGR